MIIYEKIIAFFVFSLFVFYPLKHHLKVVCHIAKSTQEKRVIKKVGGGALAFCSDIKNGPRIYYRIKFLLQINSQ